MKKVFALVDCNNFYASCERLFRPELNGKPVVVLSNNDGCVIARSNEAKALGITMGAPYFQNKTLMQQNNVQVFSSNYALYGDLSHRVMDLLQQLEPEVEIYSIDEAFIGLPVGRIRPLTEYAHWLRKRVRQCVGIPVSIGIAPTKTLAKIANRIAKKNASCEGVFDITEHGDPDGLLAAVAVEDVWGIGRQYASKLNRQGIFNGLQLKNGDPAWIRKHLTVTGLRTVMELQGVSCLPLADIPGDRKSLVSSRSFGRPVTSRGDLREAVASYVSAAAARLRAQGLVAGFLHVFLATNRFKEDLPQYSGCLMTALPQPTGCTSTLIRSACQVLERIYKPGYEYQKAGVMLTGLVSRKRCQQNLFLPPADERADLMAAMDRINTRWGRNTLQFAAAGLAKPWTMRQYRKSPAYTTNWGELPVATAG
jgi:DNA polymerase V